MHTNDNDETNPECSVNQSRDEILKKLLYRIIIIGRHQSQFVQSVHKLFVVQFKIIYDQDYLPSVSI